MLKADKTFNLNGVTVNEFLLTKHNKNKISMPSKMNGKVIGVTLHNTPDLKNVNDDAEQYTRATYNGNMGTARVHFYVDDLGAWQNLPLDNQSWHAGQSGKPAQYGSGKGNSNTISIECIMKSDDLSVEENAKARDNSARLIAYLLNKYNLSIDNLYTHNYWVNVRNGKKGSVDQLNKLNDGYKGCPLYIRPKWDDFKELVKSYMKEPSTTPQKGTETAFKSYKVKVIVDELNVRKTPNWSDSDVVTTVKKNEVFTIVDEKMLDNVKFGKLKSGLGYISIGSKYVKKM